MAQRRHHYERAFERYLRANRIPYIAVDEAKKALLPESPGRSPAAPDSLKSFDFVVYRRSRNLLLDVKGRRIGSRSPGAAARLDPWVTEEDIESLEAWGRLFGASFVPALVFCGWCDDCPAGALFEEIFEHQGRWYALRGVTVADYRAEMRPRSARWRTVCVPARRFETISAPFASLAGGSPVRAGGNTCRASSGQPGVAARSRVALAPGRGPAYRRRS